MAAAFQKELDDSSATVASSRFLASAARLSETGHSNRIPDLFEQYGLQAKIETTNLDIGLKRLHPVLRVQDLLQTLSVANKLDKIFLQGHSLKDFSTFWSRFYNTKGGSQHPVFKYHGDHLQHCVPVYLHCDEGTGPKKRGLLVLQFQPVLGAGSRRGDDLNFSGSTYTNRMLYSVLKTSLYAKQKVVLYKLLQHWSDDWSQAFKDGISVRHNNIRVLLYPIVLGLKGDWAGLVKMGRLTRHFGRDAPLSSSPPGVCHLCKAGQLGYPWHENDVNAAWLLDPSPEASDPWATPSPLMSIPSGGGGRFYLVDIFHTLHKGVYGDFAASAIASCSHVSKFCLPVEGLFFFFFRALCFSLSFSL